MIGHDLKNIQFNGRKPFRQFYPFAVGYFTQFIQYHPGRGGLTIRDRGGVNGERVNRAPTVGVTLAVAPFWDRGGAFVWDRGEPCPYDVAETADAVLATKGNEIQTCF